MKRSIKSFAKKAFNLYQSIHQQLSVYAGAAVVAVVSVLALTQPSEAEIVYTHANVVISCTPVNGRCGRTYNLDLDHDGVTDFTIEYEATYSTVPPCDDSRYVTELPASGNGAIGGPFSAAALTQGAPIGHGQQFQGGMGTMAFFHLVQHFHTCFPAMGGPWFNVTDRYLGLSFQHNGRTHYGWARLTVPGPYIILYAKLTGYAYETIAGKAIKAGQKKEVQDDPTKEDLGPAASLTNPIPDAPQLASLGMLALGAEGVPLWRRRESALEGGLIGAL
jgi:hypothetical protein